MQVRTSYLLMPVTSSSDTHYFILIRGLIRSRFHWHTFPKTFSANLDQSNISHKVITLNIAGNGERFDEKTPLTIEAMASDACNEIMTLLNDSLGLSGHDPKIHLVGISMGGMIASHLAKLLIAQDRPPSSLHIINSSFSDVASLLKRFKLKAGLSLVTHLTSISQREQCILKWTSNKEDTEQLAEAWIKEAKQHPISLRNGLVQLYAASRCPIPEKPEVLCRVYGSVNDRLVDFECSKQIAEKWQVPLLIANKSGHDLSLDEPEWLAESISQQIFN